MLHDLQRAFREGLLAGDETAALAAIASGELTPAERFEVYRNNVFGSLFEVLTAAFPATAKLAGFALFRRAAARFIATQPPRRPHLATYGDGFPAFLASFTATADTPLLAAMARLEWARIEALFAADADPLDPAALTAIAPDKLGGVRLQPHPSLRLVCSDWPLDALWHDCQVETSAPAVPPAADECLQVLRAGWQVQQHRLTVAEDAFLAACLERRTLGEAVERALACDAALDLQTLLFAHLNRGSFAALSNDPEE